MRVALLVLGLLLAPATIADNWWIQSYGFDQTKLDGSGVTIAVIDTGIDSSHPDLQGTVVDGVDFSSVGVPNGTSGVGSSAFHGTMVASLAAGRGSGPVPQPKFALSRIAESFLTRIQPPVQRCDQQQQRRQVGGNVHYLGRGRGFCDRAQVQSAVLLRNPARRLCA